MTAPELLQPSSASVEAALRRGAPDLAGPDIEYLGAGWDFWAYAAGEHVLRIPKRANYLGKLTNDGPLLAAIAPRLPFPVPLLERQCTDGPNGLPFSIYRRVPGVPLLDLKGPPAPGFGRDLGRFLRALHAFPVDEALSFGLEYVDGALARKNRIDQYETMVRRAFPLLGCETRSHVASIIEAHLNNPAEYVFEPRLSHADIDDRNVLADPATGELTGVIDFGDADVGPVVGDFTWAYCGGFERLGIADQIPDLLAEGGIEESAFDGRCSFVEVWWPLHDILHGLDIGDEDYIAEAIGRLNAQTPRGMRC